MWQKQKFISDSSDNYRDGLQVFGDRFLEEYHLPRNDFERLLQEAVDEGLSALGESGKQAIYYHLERILGIRREEISRNVEAFAEAIEKIFGQGANYLEILIMKRLYEKTGLSLKGKRLENLGFTEYIAVSKKRFLEKRAPVTAEKDVQRKEQG